MANWTLLDFFSSSNKLALHLPLPPFQLLHLPRLLSSTVTIHLPLSVRVTVLVPVPHLLPHLLPSPPRLPTPLLLLLLLSLIFHLSACMLGCRPTNLKHLRYPSALLPHGNTRRSPLHPQYFYLCTSIANARSTSHLPTDLPSIIPLAPGQWRHYPHYQQLHWLPHRLRDGNSLLR